MKQKKEEEMFNKENVTTLLHRINLIISTTAFSLDMTFGEVKEALILSLEQQEKEIEDSRLYDDQKKEK